jgi:hypothetical protein
MTAPREPEAVRFADILTTATAAANYLGEADVGPRHVLHALAILRGEAPMESLGRPVSPLVPRRPGGGVDPAVRDLVQRWFAALGSNVDATLEGEALERFIAEVRALSES